MGMLITYHRTNGWDISLKEEWEVETLVDAKAMIDWLMSKNIPFDVRYSFELVHIKMDNVVIRCSDFKKMKDVLDKLLDYKKKFGEIKNFEPPKKKEQFGALFG